MLVKLKCQVALGGKVYPAGVHSLPDSLSMHWFFKALQKDGAIVVLENASEAAPVVKDEEPAEVEETKEEETVDGEKEMDPDYDNTKSKKKQKRK